MACRICGNKTKIALDLGSSPPANSLLEFPNEEIKKFPLVLEYCSNCSNIQLRDCLDINELYKYYFYVTPNSSTLNTHYFNLTRFLESRNYLNQNSMVLEIGSNRGLYLKFIKEKVKSILGIDPASNIVEQANNDGINTINAFFNEKLADTILDKKGRFNLIIARHCFAHNSSPHQLLKGVKKLLAKNGFIVIENAYVLNTIENNEFDQIYHEHMFYFSISSMREAFKKNGLFLHDVFLSLIHGGSIVFIASHNELNMKPSKNLKLHLDNESKYLTLNAIELFKKKTFQIKDKLFKLVVELNLQGKIIYSYGATAKGNTLLNFVGLTNKEIKYCIDNTDIKEGKYLPGSNIKIKSEEFAIENPPDYFLLTAWNYKDEIIDKVRSYGNNDSLFIIPFPNLKIL